MMSPETAMMMARARQASLRAEAERSAMARRDERNHGWEGRRGIGDGLSAQGVLVSKVCELTRLAESLGFERDDVVRMIQSS
jgi:hypothetical protein